MGEQPLHLLRLSTLRQYLRCDFAEFLAPTPPGEEEWAAPRWQQQPQQQGLCGGPQGQRLQRLRQGEGVSSSGGVATPPRQPREGGGSGGATSGPGSPRVALWQEEGVDLITGERKKALTRPPKRQQLQRSQQAEQAVQQAGEEEEEGEDDVPGTPGGDGGIKGGGRDFERVLDDIVFLTFLAGG